MRASPELDPRLHSLARVGILGGSFDPPHAGHLAMARAARAAHGLEHLLWVPAARPPHKPDRILAPAAARVRMLELLLAEEGDSSIWTVELERPGLSFTVDTLRTLTDELCDPRRGAQLFLILGSDNLAGLPGWRAVEEVLELALPIVLPRGEGPTLPPELSRLGPALERRVREALLPAERVDISSTEIRAALAAGASRPAFLPAPLWEYLRTSGFYGSASPGSSPGPTPEEAPPDPRS